MRPEDEVRFADPQFLWCKHGSVWFGVSWVTWLLSTKGPEWRSADSCETLFCSSGSVSNSAPQQIMFWLVSWSPSSVLNSQGTCKADPQNQQGKKWRNSMYVLCSSNIRTRLGLSTGIHWNIKTLNSPELCIVWMVLLLCFLLYTAQNRTSGQVGMTYKGHFAWSQREWLNLHQFRKTLAEISQKILK